MEILGDAAPDVPEANRRSQRRDPDLDLDLLPPGSGAPATAGVPAPGAGPGPAAVPSPGPAQSGPRGQVPAGALEEYDVGVPGERLDGGSPQAPGLSQVVAATLTSEALGLTALLLVLAGVIGFPSPFLWAEYGAEGPGYEPRDASEFSGRATGLLALLATGLGVTAVLRLGARPTPLARGLAGAAVLAGILLLGYAAALLWHVAGVPVTPQTPAVP